jgi:hypothetical protein
VDNVKELYQIVQEAKSHLVMTYYCEDKDEYNFHRTLRNILLKKLISICNGIDDVNPSLTETLFNYVYSRRIYGSLTSDSVRSYLCEQAQYMRILLFHNIDPLARTREFLDMLETNLSLDVRRW